MLAQFLCDRLVVVVADGTDLIWFSFLAFASFGDVVLLVTFDACGLVGRALSSSGFVIGFFVGWPCTVSIHGVAWAGVPLVCLIGGFDGACCGWLAKLSIFIGIAELDQTVDVVKALVDSLGDCLAS